MSSSQVDKAPVDTGTATSGGGSGGTSPRSGRATTSTVAPGLPDPKRQYRAAVAAVAPSGTQSIRPPPQPQPQRERFADLKWMFGRELRPPSSLTREQIESRVLSSARVQSAIDQCISGGAESSSTSSAPPTRAESRRAAAAIFASMYATIDPTVVRASAYALRKVWRQMYEGIRVNEDGIEQLQRFAKARTPVVLCPMHKSHIDYLLLTYVCCAYNLFPPHIIAGANLNMPLVGSILRHGGGLFIRRSFGTDELYKAVFAEYLHVILDSGHMLEVYVEGTRSRQGKVKRPKTGVLTVLVDELANGRLGDRDIMLVPIALSYDKVIEGATYVNEMLGARKQKESLTQTLNSINHVVRLNFGSIDVSIGQAISMREALHMPAPGSAVPRDHAFLSSSPAAADGLPYHARSPADQKRLVLSLAHRVCYELNRRAVVSATSIVAAVLLTNLHRGISRRALLERTDTLKRMVLERGGAVAPIFSSEPLPAVVERALSVLSKLIQQQHGIVYGFRNYTALELSIYRNQLLHLFIAEAMVCVAMAAEYNDAITRAKTRTTAGATDAALAGAAGAGVQVSKARLISSVRFISQLLKFEFIFAPAPDIETNVEETLDALIARQILLPAPTVAGVQSSSAGPAAATAASASSPVSSCSALLLAPSGVESLLMLAMLAWPFIETYWVALASLHALLPDRIFEASKLAELASRRAEALYYSGGVEFYESMNTEYLLNAYEWCVSQGILRVHQVAAGTRMLQLTPEFQQAPRADATPAADASGASASCDGRPTSLRDLLMRVGRFRKSQLLASAQSSSLLDAFVRELHGAGATGELDQPMPTQTSAAAASATILPGGHTSGAQAAAQVARDVLRRPLATLKARL